MSIYDIVNRVCESQEKIALMRDITGAGIAVGLVIGVGALIALFVHLTHKYDL